MFRFAEKDRVEDGLPWNAIGAGLLLASLMVNLISIPMNFLHHDELVSKSPGISIDLGMGIATRSLTPRSLNGIANTFASDGVITEVQEADTFELFPRRLTVAGAANHSNSTKSTTGHSASSDCGSGSAGSAAHGGHHNHPHLTLIYLLCAFVIGAAVMQISARWPMLQQTVLLFVLGFFVSLIIKGADVQGDMGRFGESYGMWMDIDPHLLLFTLLPALLAGDAMTIDTSVAKRVGMQCLYLAGPGVLIGGFSTAAFLYALLGWNFQLCLCSAAMLCATDPVAVVALLKELGASPIITVQIQGESLLNDGTAIVLYLVAYNMLSGHQYDAADIAEFLIKKAMMAWALGCFIGYFFFSWIRAASDKLSHASGTIQITLTLCCAYWSFIFVEGVLTLSGVLATVASSLILAHHMWPYIVSPESMHHVWHTFESLGNMIVFFLAGSKTGHIFLDIDPLDILNLMAIYLFLVFIRGALIFGSLPLLKQLSADKLPVTWQDACLMTWGGLRGAVGLALALAVNNDRAAHKDTGEPQIPKKDAERVLFFVAGIAFLTTLVNATTAPTLVAKLGITALPQARQLLLKMFHCQLVFWSTDNKHPPAVVEALREMLHESEHEIEHQAVSKTGPRSSRAVTPEELHALNDSDKQRFADVTRSETLGNSGQTHAQIINELQEQEQLYKAMPKDELHQGLLGQELEENLLGNVDDIIALLRVQNVDVGMAKVVNQVFLSMVFQNYWNLIEEGELRPGSPEAEVLLTSIRMSLSPYRADLHDFDYVNDKMLKDAEFKDDADDDEMAGLADADLAVAAQASALGAVVASWQFNVTVALMILLNSIQVIAEEAFRDPDKAINNHVVWLVLDAFFTIFFLGEAVMKLAVMKGSYFGSTWNRFDFFLVVVGLFGLGMGFVTRGKEAEMAGKTRIIRIARVLRTLRFLRIFRLFHARMSADKYVSLELARHMKKVVTLDCFIRAQVKAQNDLIKFFGGNGKIDLACETELGRCVLQSQVSTYKALREAANTQVRLGDDVYTELKHLHKRKTITENLSKFVLTAHEDGAISATEAHSILHPLHHNIAQCVQTLNDRADGVLQTKPTCQTSFAHSQSSQSNLGAEHTVPPPLAPAETMGDGQLRLLGNGGVIADPPAEATGATSVTLKSPASEDSADILPGAAKVEQDSADILPGAAKAEQELPVTIPA